MSLVRASWRFGALPALPVVAVLFAVATAAALLVDEATMDTVGGVLVIALLTYCVARPANGTDVFLAAAAPGAIAQLAHEFLGAPRWIFFVLLPIALIGAWNADHGDAGDDDAGHGDAGHGDAGHGDHGEAGEDDLGEGTGTHEAPAVRA